VLWFVTPSKNSSAVNNLRREAAAAGVDPRRLFFSKCERAPPVGPARNGLLHQTQRPVAPNATCQCGLRCRMDCCGCAASACVRCASQVCGLGAALEARSRSRRLRRLIHVQCAHDIGRCAVGWRAGAEQVSPGTPAAMTNVHDESRRRCGPTNVCFCFRPARTMVSRLSAGVLESAHLGRYSPTPASRCCGVLQRGYRCSGCFGHCEY
jgi:hypothetical protein